MLNKLQLIVIISLMPILSALANDDRDNDNPHDLGCTFSATSLNFGTYNPVNNSSTKSSGTITVTCRYHPTQNNHTYTISYTIKLSEGNSNNFNDRKLISNTASGTSFLSYNLFSDPSYTRIWGDGSGGTGYKSNQYTLTPNKKSRSDNFPVYGQITKNQFVSPGTYKDTITVTVTY